MKTIFLTAATLGVAAVVAGCSTNPVSQWEASTLTCGQYVALDDQGRIDATNAIVTYISDANNATVGGGLADALKEMDTAEVRGRIDNSCNGQTASTNVIEALK
jgi:hypothetical protein